MDKSRVTRREILRAGALGAAALALPPGFAQGERFAFRLGIQSYSLRGFDLGGALDRTKELGLSFWEAYPAHIPLTEDAETLKSIRKAHEARSVRLTAWGVQGFNGDEEAARRVFVFAKALGIEVVTADPTPEALPVLAKLTEEFGIRIAIHNHGPGARYDKLESLQKALASTSPGVGVCIDTGHALRSKEDPVDWVRALKGRVHGVHLKDVKDASRFTVLGKGDLRLQPFLAELRNQRFSGPLNLEYEENPDSPMQDIRECLSVLRAAIQF